MFDLYSMWDVGRKMAIQVWEDKLRKMGHKVYVGVDDYFA